jgi:hypothetical protein
MDLCAVRQQAGDMGRVYGHNAPEHAGDGL